MGEIVALQRYPAWRQAVLDVLNGFKYGDVIPNEWLAERIGMPTLEDGQSMTADEFRDRQFLWLASIESLKSELLRDHQVMLVSVRGVGYKWVHPSEQTGEAMKRFESNAKKLFGQAARAVSSVRVAELTDDQRRANTDAATKLSALAGMAKKVLQ